MINSINARSDESDTTDLATKIREARIYLGVDAKVAANSIGVSTEDYSEIECGKRPLTDNELEKLAILFHRPLNFFLVSEPTINNDLKIMTRKKTEISDNDKKELLEFAKFIKKYPKG